MFAFLTLSRIVSTNEAKDSWVCNSMFRFLKSEPPLRGMSFCQTSRVMSAYCQLRRTRWPPSSFRANRVIFKSWIISTRFETRAISFKTYDSQFFSEILNFTKKIGRFYRKTHLSILLIENFTKFFEFVQSICVCNYLNLIHGEDQLKIHMKYIFDKQTNNIFAEFFFKFIYIYLSLFTKMKQRVVSRDHEHSNSTNSIS